MLAGAINITALLTAAAASENAVTFALPENVVPRHGPRRGRLSPTTATTEKSGPVGRMQAVLSPIIRAEPQPEGFLEC